MFKGVLSAYKSQGLRGIFANVLRRPVRKKAGCFSICEELLSKGVGLEIGGPSTVFKKRRILPVYPILNRLDNCNFSNKTIWEGTINEGITFQYDKKRPLGGQYICEATILQNIASVQYDFILSSHVIEHIANPLQALSEWIRVLKEEGILVLVVPHKDGTFDHKRHVTTVKHLVEDFEKGTTEKDLTHLQEILKLHDLEKDPGAGTFEDFKQRSENNFENRCLHHHVFDTALVLQIVHHMNLQILAVETILPYHIIVIAQKLPTGHLPDNQLFIGDKAEYRHQSPFVSDRHPLDPENL